MSDRNLILMVLHTKHLHFFLTNLMDVLDALELLWEMHVSYDLTSRTGCSSNIKGALSDLFISYLSAICWIF